MDNYAIVRSIKGAVLSHDIVPHKIRVGVYRGIIRRMASHESQQVIWGLWERETSRYLRRALTAKWMIDVGAGFGEMAVLFAMRSEASPIYAIEPGTNHHGGHLHNIVDTMKLNHVNPRRIMTLDRFVGAAPNFPLDDFELAPGTGFIKIDVDGAEMDVLRSGARMLRERRPMILLETHTAELEAECSTFLKGLGYRITIIPNAWWRALLPERRRIPHNRWLWAE